MNQISDSIDEIIGPHQIIYDYYFSQADPNDSGIISALDAAAFLKQSKLNDSILKQIWDLADPTGKGYLDRCSFYVTLKFVALTQSNIDIKLENLKKSNIGPPKLGELTSNMSVLNGIRELISSDDTWYIKASSRINFDKTFDTLSPINNKISGTRVKPFLLNSGLAIDILGKIWELSDIDQDGQLTRSEFLIAMQLVSKAKEGLTIPEQLPSSLLPFKTRHLSIPSSVNNFDSKSWVVTFDEKTKSDALFLTLDTDKDGFVNGGELKDVFMKTGLPQLVLANIWNLCDINNNGKLNSEQFALAMHFINKKLATGLDPPIELTSEMLPPSLRPKHHVEESFMSKDLEELQTQVNELQREKLYYEQRASEHDILTRQKRTELSNLELEMDSLYKTLRERELNRSEEQKKLNDYEDKLHKLDNQLVELKKIYENEKREIETLKFQIANMESSALNKENDLGKIKNDLQLMKTEKANLELRVNTRRNNYNELKNSLVLVECENKKNKEKMIILKSIQVNLNKLLKEYGYSLTNSAQNTDEIKRLEEENIKLKEKLKLENINEPILNDVVISNKKPISTTPTIQYNPTISNNTTSSLIMTSNQSNINENNFDDLVSHSSLSTATDFNDPFNTFDPFKDNDPFKTANNQIFDNDFSNAFDPFKSNIDPFDSSKDKKKPPPPRPAPPNPRPQTPNLKPAKKQFETSQRPQSAMDFTTNAKLDIFNDFDPFSSSNNAGNKSNWTAFN